jgi:hypothetical protein
MGLKERVMELMRCTDGDGLEQLACAEPRAARHLLGRLWDVDEATRALAARGLGASAEAHPEIGVDLIRRLMWALNDESATNGVYGVAALGEIGRRSPGLFAPFVGPLASYLWDDGLRPEILKALDRIVERHPGLADDVRERVAACAGLDGAEEDELIRRIIERTVDDDGA